MARYSVNNYTVETLLSNIKSGSIAIPEMQRPFVWDSSKVRDLVDSLYKGFPVGYIIVWQNPDVKLKDGTKSSGKKVLIDGQQRITAMAAAIVGQEVLDDHYKWKRISIAFNPVEEKFEVANNAILKSSKWIPDIAPVLEPAFDTFSFVINSIAKMLKNRRYIGEYSFRDVVVPHSIPAIVPENLFERVQEKIEKNKKAPARHKAEDDYLLPTKLFCGHCGAYMCGESGRGRNGTVHRYYKCVSVKKKRTDCKKKAVKKD